MFSLNNDSNDYKTIDKNIDFKSLKIAYSGTHGTGKTTSVFNMATYCKMKYPKKSVHVITETASESPFKINKQTSEESQLWIYTKQIQNELENSLKYNILISDRSIVDCIAYSQVAGFTKLVRYQHDFAKYYLKNYDYIFFKKIETNDFLFKDGIRDSEDLEFRQKVENELLNLYTDSLIGLSKHLKHKDTLQFI